MIDNKHTMNISALVFILLIPVCIILIVIVSFSIWAVWEINKNKNLDRETKRELTNLVTWWPIWGFFDYYFSIRPKLKKQK